MKTSIYHYPFGSLMPGRQGNSGDYRYGFNGHEKDDEISGNGNSYDFGARMFDPRLGRFRSTDPWADKYSWQSSYAYYANSPIAKIDWNGFGDYYDKDGKHLGSDGKTKTVNNSDGTTSEVADDKVYTLSQSTIDAYTKDGKTDWDKVIADANTTDLGITHTEFRKQASTVYGESTAYKMNTVTDDLKKEMFAIASVHQNNKIAFGATSNKAKEYLALTPSKINNSKFKTTANAAVINALTGGFDYSYGATMWDGQEQALKPSSFTTFSSGGVEYHMNTMGWTITDAHFKIWKKNIGSNFKASQVNYTPVLTKGTAAFNKYYTENAIKLQSKAVYGETIFWKELKGSEILKKK